MRRLLLYIILLISISGISGIKAQGEISLLVEPDTNIILIGQQVNLSITIKQPRDLKINFPNLDNNMDSKLEVMEVSGIDSNYITPAVIELKQKILLTSFDTGICIIPPLPFEMDFGDKKDTLFSRSVYMLVLTMVLDTTNNIFDIKPIYPMKYSFSEFVRSPYFYVSIGIVILAILTLLFFKFYKKEEGETIISKPKIPAHVIALKELDALKNEKLWQQNKTKEYYSKLTEIIRNYIELRFEIPALEQTSTEILTEFKGKKNIDDKMVDHLEELLSLADLIKFAKGTALPDENERNMESAYDFVRKTKIVQQVVESTDGMPSDSKNDVEPLKDTE